MDIATYKVIFMHMAHSPSDEFKPLPLFRSGHRQTILGYLLRKWQRSMPAELHHIPLPDGDVLEIHDATPTTWQDGCPIVLIVHGLGGCHHSGSVLRLAWECHRRSWRVVRVNMRGSGGSIPGNKKPYHAGCSDDILQVLKAVTTWSSESVFGLVGLSLGGNVVLKLAGETEQNAFPMLRKIVSVSPPVDLERSSQMLAQPGNAVYEKRFVKELIEMAQERAQMHKQELPLFPAGLKLREFDDIYTAPRSGYLNVADYYHRASSKSLLGKIEIPTHIISAVDDPMIDPFAIETAERSSAVSLQLTRYGGHLGFISSPRQNGWCWLEGQVAQQLQTAFTDVNKVR